VLLQEQETYEYFYKVSKTLKIPLHNLVHSKWDTAHGVHQQSLTRLGMWVSRIWCPCGIWLSSRR
jgi:hypothetical protein